jgi:uncharacterized membrane protein
MTPCSVTREVTRRCAVSITVGCLVPGLLFYSFYALAGVWPAIGAALAWTCGALVWRRTTGRPVSGLLVLAAGVMALRTVVSLVAGSPFLYFLQPVLTDLVIGSAFLLSMLTARPVVARMAPDFYPMDDATAAKRGVRRLFAGLTAVWGTVCLVKGGAMLWLLLTQSIDTYVMVRGMSVPVLNGLGFAITVTASVIVARREGLLRPPAPVEPVAPKELSAAAA